MKVIYIAGPFRAGTAWHRKLNVMDALHVAVAVARLGAMPLCPHSNTEHFDGTLTDEFWIRGTLELLKRCDALVTVPTWRGSVGARGEVGWASENGVPVFHDLESLKQWLREQETAP